MGVRFRNVSATSAIKRPFAVQIITDVPDVGLFFSAAVEFQIAL